MAGRRYNPATQAIIEGMLKQKINPVDDGLKTDAARGFAAGLMGKPGYDTSTWHGALRGAGDKMLGAYMLKQSDQKYADQRQVKDTANDTLWNQAIASMQSEQDADAQRQTLEDERWQKKFDQDERMQQAQIAKMQADMAASAQKGAGASPAFSMSAPQTGAPAQPAAEPQPTEGSAPQPTSAAQYRAGGIYDINGREFTVDPKADVKWGKQEEVVFPDGTRHIVQSDPSGNYMRYVSVSPKYTQEREAGAMKEKNFMNTYATANNAFDSALGLLEKGGNSGFWGAMGKNIPGTEAFRANAALETVRGMVLVDTLAALKAASPTGASGFGQLSDSEGRRIMAMKGSLDMGLDKETLMRNIKNIRREYDDMLGSWGYEVPRREDSGFQSGVEQARTTAKRRVYNPSTGRVE